MELRPIGNKLLLKEIAVSNETKSGIILPDEKDDRSPREGEVIAMARNPEVENLRLAVGDRIVFNPRKAIKIKHEDNDYTLVSIDDILLQSTKK